MARPNCQTALVAARRPDDADLEEVDDLTDEALDAAFLEALERES